MRLFFSRRGLCRGAASDALDDPDLLPPPEEVAAELASFQSVAAKLQGA
jgi:hypothetical protein